MPFLRLILPVLAAAALTVALAAWLAPELMPAPGGPGLTGAIGLCLLIAARVLRRRPGGGSGW